MKQEIAITTECPTVSGIYWASSGTFEPWRIAEVVCLPGGGAAVSIPGDDWTYTSNDFMYWCGPLLPPDDKA